MLTKRNIMASFYTQVGERLYQGHELANDGTDSEGETWTVERKTKTLQDLGVTHILNLHDQREVPGFIYAHVPIIDDKSHVKPLELIWQAAEFGLNAIQSGGTLYVHCVAGVARSSAITYAILRLQGHSIQDSFNSIAKRPGFESIYISAAEDAVRRAQWVPV